MLTDLGHRPLIVAAVTPLRDDGSQLDEEAIGPYVAFLEAHGADGVFACGTTGEGILLTLEERRRAARAFRDALRGTLIVHAGAQATADTVALAADAAEHRGRCGRGHSAAVLPARRCSAGGALRSRGPCLRAAPLLLLRLHRPLGLPAAGRGHRAHRKCRRQPGRPQGQRVAIRASRAVSRARPARPDRVRAADRRRRCGRRSRDGFRHGGRLPGRRALRPGRGR